MICVGHQIFSGNPIKKDEIGGACSTYRERNVAYRVLEGNF
jgi:hypothetical protein